jgi:hypothetical protein
MRAILGLAAVAGLVAALAIPASAETCLYLTKPGAPRKLVCVPPTE